MRLPWRKPKTRKVILDIGGQHVEVVLTWSKRQQAWVNKQRILFTNLPTWKSHVTGFAVEMKEDDRGR